MSADFLAGYLSGAVGIIVGNPLDLIKVRLQAGPLSLTPGTSSPLRYFDSAGSLVRGATAPILGYGALNALLFVSYNRTLLLLADEPSSPFSTWKPFFAGATGGLAQWVVSAPTELIKCRTQLSPLRHTSWEIARETIRTSGLRGLYFGGSITSLRDSVGYGFYFWSYELSKRYMSSSTQTDMQAAGTVLLCGGIAGIVTWASIYPLDVVKTRVQGQLLFPHPDTAPLLQGNTAVLKNRRGIGALEMTRAIYGSEGWRGFFRGLGVCSARAFVVNAVQWAVYEWVMRRLT